MFGFLFNISIWQLVQTADFFTQLVLLGLFVTSIASIAIVVHKYLQFKKEKSDLSALVREIQSTHSIEDISKITARYAETTGGEFVRACIREIERIHNRFKGRHEFDAFILGYGRLSMDPDYLRNFFHSANDKQRGWNMSGYNNPEFDRIADKSASEMNPEQRKKLIFKMQKIIMEDVPYIPIYNPALIEAVRKDTFTGWVETLDGIGNLWSFCLVKPNDATSQ